MFKSHRLFSALLFSSAFLISSQAHAENYLDNNKIKELVTGKTIYSKHLKKDFDFSAYFDADGKTAIRKKRNGDIVKTSYSIEGNKHCMQWKGKNRCARIIDNGDGTYTRVNKKGKKIIKWLKFEAGNKV